MGPKPMDVVASWTGERADLLRRALRMTNEAFAEHLGVAVRTVAYWRSQSDIVPRPAIQEILDTALAQASESVLAQFRLLLAERERGNASIAAAAGSTAPEDAASITQWLAATGTSDEAISVIDRTAAALAEAHTQLAPGIVMADVRKLQQATQALLRNGKPRHRQARELLRINGSLLAHLSLLLSDRSDYYAADEYGNAALLYQEEAGANETTAWYVLAKSARWQHRYAQAADLAHQGLQHSCLDAMRIQLACYEANASALYGDSARARTAMTQAEEAAAALPTGQLTVSPWSFPEERMTIFRLSVALGTDDPQGALQAAAAATTDWKSGPHVPAAWAQIKVGAGIAYLLQNELDGAAREVTPMLALPPAFRIATVTGWLADLDRRLSVKHFAGSPIAKDLRQQIRDFSSAPLHDQDGRQDG
jgi:hypothetical protein